MPLQTRPQLTRQCKNTPFPGPNIKLWHAPCIMMMEGELLPMHQPHRLISGFTLIEFIVALVVLGLGAALLVSFITPVAGSADPMIQAQARAIAAAYMDEILLRDHGDLTACPNNRSEWQFIQCYDLLPFGQAPHDQFGDPISALADYQVTVIVGSGNLAEIEVQVTHTSGRGGFTLQSARGNY